MKIWLTSQSWACIYCSKFSKSNLWQARGDVVWCGVVTRFAAETGHDKLKQVCTLLLCHGLSRNSTKSRTNKASTILSLFFFLSLSLSFSLSLSLSLSHSLKCHTFSQNTHTVYLSLFPLSSFSLFFISASLSLSVSYSLFPSFSLPMATLLDFPLSRLCNYFSHVW